MATLAVQLGRRFHRFLLRRERTLEACGKIVAGMSPDKLQTVRHAPGNMMFYVANGSHLIGYEAYGNEAVFGVLGEYREYVRLNVGIQNFNALKFKCKLWRNSRGFRISTCNRLLDFHIAENIIMHRSPHLEKMTIFSKCGYEIKISDHTKNKKVATLQLTPTFS